MDYEYLKREKNLLNSSEAQLHEKSPGDRQNYAQPVRGYAPHPAEREERGEAKEMFSLQNSYNTLSVGADKKGDITVAGSAQRRHNRPTLQSAAKQVEGSRRKKHHGNGGELFTNPSKEAESAFAYRVNRRTPEKKMLRKLREQSRRHELNRMNETMPFLDLHKNEAELQRMRREEAPLHETQAMEKIISDKKNMEAKFLKNLRITRRRIIGMDLRELQKLLYKKELADPLLLQNISAPAAEDDTDENEDGTEEENSK